MSSFAPRGPDPWVAMQALAMCSAAYQYAEDLDSYFRGVSHDIKFCSLSVADPYGGRIAIGLANKGDDQYTFIALSGTSNLKAVLTNFAESPTSTSAGEVGAHKAFLERSTSISLDYLFDTAAKGKLVITGHSLGGACATLLTAAFVQKYVDRNCVMSVCCITFGSPLVCQSPSFCAYMSPFRGLFTHYVSEKDSIAISLSSRRVLSDYGFVNDNQSDEQGALEPFGTHIKLGLVQATGQTAALPLSLEETTAHFAHSGTLSLAEFEVKLEAHELKAYKVNLFRAGVIAGGRDGEPKVAPGEIDAVKLRPKYCILRGHFLEVYGSGMWLLSSIVLTENGDRYFAVRRTENVAYFIPKDVDALPVENIGTTNYLILQFFSFFNHVTTSATLPLNKVDVEEGLMPDALLSRMMPLCNLAIFEGAKEGCEAQEQFLDLRSHCNNIVTNLPMEFVFCVISRTCVGAQQQLYGKFVKMLLQRLEEVVIDPGSLVSVSMINVLGEVIARLNALSTDEKKSLNNVGILSSKESLMSRRTVSSATPPGFSKFHQVSLPGRHMLYASGAPDGRTNYWRMVYEYQIGVSVILVADAAKLVGEIAQESFMFLFGAANDEEVNFQLKKSVSIGGLVYRVYDVSCDLGDIQYTFNFYMFGVEELNERTFNSITVLLKCAPFSECLATAGWLHVMSESTEEIAAFACSNVSTAWKKSYDEVKFKYLEVLRAQIGQLSASNSHDTKWAAFVDNYNSRRELITGNVRAMYYLWLAKEESAESRLISYFSGLKRAIHRTHKRVGASYFCGQSISMIVRNRATGENEPFFNFMPTARRRTERLTKVELIKSANEISDASQFLSLLLEGAVQRASVHLDEPGSLIKVVTKSLVFPVSALVDTMYGIGNVGLYIWNSGDPQYLRTAHNNFVDSWHAIAYSQRLLASYEEILKAICDKASLKIAPGFQSGSHAINMENSVARSVEHTKEIVNSSVSDLCSVPTGFLMSTRYYSYVNERRNLPVLLFFLKLAFSSWKIRNTRKKFTVVTIGGKNNGGKTTLIDELFPGKLAPEDKPGGTADRTTIFPRAFSMVDDPYMLYIDLPGITDASTFDVARMMARCGNVSVFVLEALMSKSDNNEVNIESIKEFLTQKKGPGLICINQFDRNLDAEDPVGHDSDDDCEPRYYSDSESDCGSGGGAARSVTPMLDTGDGVEESKGAAAAVVTAKEFWDPPTGGSVDPLEAEYERRLMRIVSDEAEAWKRSEFLKVKERLTEAEPMICERGHNGRVGVESGHEAVHAKGCGCGCAQAVVFSGTDANGWRTSIWLTCFDRKSRIGNRNSQFVDKNVFSPADVQAWVLEANSKPNAYSFGGH